jgi:hypothetical protein
MGRPLGKPGNGAVGNGGAPVGKLGSEAVGIGGMPTGVVPETWRSTMGAARALDGVVSCGTTGWGWSYVYPTAMKATTVNFMLGGWEVYV